MKFIFILLVYTCLPAWILIKLWINRSPNLGKWLFEAITNTLVIAFLVFLGLWPMGSGYYVRYGVAALFCICLLKSYLNVKREFVFERPSIRSTFFYSINLAACCFLIWQIALGIQGSFAPSKAIDLDFPIKNGLFYIAHGGGSESINHHFRIVEQRYALDITQLNRWGTRANRWIPNTLDDFLIYGTILHSPCDGIVVEAVDEFPDLTPSMMDPAHPAGNHLVIEAPTIGAQVLLAHLMKGSLLVTKGTHVKKGQEIARIGNSGNTSEPHLHIHARDIHSKEGIPMLFQGRFLIRNDTVQY